MEIISLVIAGLGFLASVYFSNRTARKQDEETQKKDIEAIKKETQRDAEINFKLDSVLNGVTNTGSEIKDIKKDLSTLSKDYVAMSRDMKTLFTRVEKTDHHLELLHREFREHVGMEESAYHHLKHQE